MVAANNANEVVGAKTLQFESELRLSIIDGANSLDTEVWRDAKC